MEQCHLKQIIWRICISRSWMPATTLKRKFQPRPKTWSSVFWTLTLSADTLWVKRSSIRGCKELISHSCQMVKYFYLRSKKLFDLSSLIMTQHVSIEMSGSAMTSLGTASLNLTSILWIKRSEMQVRNLWSSLHSTQPWVISLVSLGQCLRWPKWKKNVKW